MHPAKGYLFLCLAQEPEMNYDEAKERLEMYGLFPGALTPESYHLLVEQFQNTERPQGYLPGSGHGESMAYEMSLSIYEGSYRTDRYQNSLRILGYPSLRNHVERLLFSRMPPEEIARTINTLLGREAHYVKEDISTYYHYFCCVEVWSAQEWRRALLDSSHSWGAAIEDVHIGNPEIARFRMGRHLAVAADEILDEIMSHVYTRLRILRMEPTSKEVVNQTATLAKIGLQAYDLAANSTRQLEDVYAQLRSIAQTRRDIITPSVDDLLLEEGAEIATPGKRSVEDEYRDQSSQIIEGIFDESV